MPWYRIEVVHTTKQTVEFATTVIGIKSMLRLIEALEDEFPHYEVRILRLKQYEKRNLHK